MQCAQYFVNSSLALVVLFRRPLKSVADVLQGIRCKEIYTVSMECSFGSFGCCFVVMVRVDLSAPFIPGTIGFSQIYMVSKSGLLIHWRRSLNRLSFVVGMLGFVSGLCGFGKI